MTAEVLIVEDNVLVAEMVRGIIDILGHTVVGHAITGQQAVQLTCELLPDVVMMDLGLPDIDGIEASRLIFERCPVPIVVLSAQDSTDIVEEASSAGVGAYLVKPSNPSEIDRAITIAMARFGDILKLRELNKSLVERNQQLQQALAQVKQLSGLLPICSSCKDIRDDEGYWHQVDIYITQHSDAQFSHALCPDCVEKLYPEMYERWKKAGRI